jgi:hypothetical protein
VELELRIAGSAERVWTIRTEQLRQIIIGYPEIDEKHLRRKLDATLTLSGGVFVTLNVYY